MESCFFEVLVDNHFGVLGRITALFSKRGFNIESLEVHKTAENPSESKMLIEIIGDGYIKDQVAKQLRKLYVVKEVKVLENKKNKEF